VDFDVDQRAGGGGVRSEGRAEAAKITLRRSVVGIVSHLGTCYRNTLRAVDAGLRELIQVRGPRDPKEYLLVAVDDHQVVISAKSGVQLLCSSSFRCFHCNRNVTMPDQEDDRWSISIC
jgi:hypothetical protein